MKPFQSVLNTQSTNHENSCQLQLELNTHVKQLHL